MTPLPNIQTENRATNRDAFIEWYVVNGHRLTPEQDNLAGIVHASFINMMTMNKDNPAAWAKLKELHDADVEKLKTMLSGEQGNRDSNDHAS